MVCGCGCGFESQPCSRSSEGGFVVPALSGGSDSSDPYAHVNHFSARWDGMAWMHGCIGRGSDLVQWSASNGCLARSSTCSGGLRLDAWLAPRRAVECFDLQTPTPRSDGVSKRGWTGTVQRCVVGGARRGWTDRNSRFACRLGVRKRGSGQVVDRQCGDRRR